MAGRGRWPDFGGERGGAGGGRARRASLLLALVGLQWCAGASVPDAALTSENEQLRLRVAALEAELLALRQRSAPVEETSRDAGGRAALWATAEAAAATERALRAEVSLSPPFEFADTPPFSPYAAPRFPHMSEMHSPFPF